MVIEKWEGAGNINPDLEGTNTEENFVYWNSNKTGDFYDDRVFQILNAFLPDMDKEELMNTIIEDLIAHGLATPDYKTTSRLIKKLLCLKEEKVSYHQVWSFTREHKDDDWLIVHVGSSIELFRKGKFYGHLPIKQSARVYGYFIPKGEPCLI